MTDEWTTVTKQDKKRIAKGRKIQINRNRQRTSAAVQAPPDATEWTDESKRLIVEQLYDYKYKLKETDFFKFLTESFNDSPIRPQQIVCYGIGNFGRQRSGPLWQLACALNLWDILQSANDESEPPVHVYFFDPCSTQLETSILHDLGIQLIQDNERGKRNIHSTATLFFMPHCPMILYFNVLLENWVSLNKVLLFGNQLCKYANRLGIDVPKGVALLVPFLKEIAMTYSKTDVRDMEGEFDRAFNDCFLTMIRCTEALPDRPDETLEDFNDEEVLY